MAELFKNIYSEKFFDSFLLSLRKVVPDFDSDSFLEQIFDSEWESRELKQRMRHISGSLKDHLSGNFQHNVNVLLALIPELKQSGTNLVGIEYMFLPDFIELYGMGDYDISMQALEEITQFVSCEFAIRPFLLAFPEKGIQQMTKWSTHKHSSVRRLATEGCRPRLPWAMALPFLKADPAPILPILERLKNDESEYVRRSVANNLNDIAKDNPETVIQIAKKWKGKTEETDWVVKHACRTLLKQGNLELMSLFGFGDVKEISIEKFQVLTPVVKIGDALEFSFNLINNSSSPSMLRLEYGLYYQKANGSLSKKVFKISEKSYDANSSTTIHRKQSFKVITTRKFHTGLHQVSLIINGIEFDTYDFELVS